MNVYDQSLCAIIILAVFLLVSKHLPDFRKPSTDSKQQYGIEAVVSEVKSELIQADLAEQKLNRSPLFTLAGFDLEINFVVKNKETTKGEFKPELVAVSTETETSSEKVQKVVLHLKPVTTEGSVRATPGVVPGQPGAGTVTHGEPPPSKDEANKP